MIEPTLVPSVESAEQEIEHTSDYSYYRFNCAHGDWSGPWWSDWESAGRDGVHHYGVAHPLTEPTTPLEQERSDD